MGCTLRIFSEVRKCGLLAHADLALICSGRWPMLWRTWQRNAVSSTRYGIKSKPTCLQIAWASDGGSLGCDHAMWIENPAVWHRPPAVADTHEAVS